MGEREELRCECGGTARWVKSGTIIDQLECTKCDYKTATYFDGCEYAEHEWRHRKPAWVPRLSPKEPQ